MKGAVYSVIECCRVELLLKSKPQNKHENTSDNDRKS